MIVRNLLPGERLESTVVTGFEAMPVDNDWCWHAIEEDVIVGSLVCAPVHGVVLLFRLVVNETASVHTTKRLLRTMFDDCNSRGYKGFMLLVGVMREEERRLHKLARRIGAKQILEPTVVLYGVNPGALELEHA